MNILREFREFREYRARCRIGASANDFLGLLEGYHPVFTSFNGQMYEKSQVRAALNANANHRSKLNIEIVGPRYKDLGKTIGMWVNPYQTTSQFLYKISTISDAENSCIIVPLYDSIAGDHVCGFYPVHPQSAEVIEHEGVVYIRYNYYGHSEAVELDRCGVMNKMSYKNEIFGDSNAALFPTLDLINIHEQSVQSAVRSSATIRFLARVKSFQPPELMKAETKRFAEDKLGSDSGGVLIFDDKYADVKPIESKPLIVDDKQLALINENIQNYFGVSKAIMQNDFTSDQWSAYYEGSVEPFAIQLSQVLTRMLFTPAEIASGSRVHLSANRLQYANNKEKLEIVSALFDRGLLTTDQSMEIFQLPPVGGTEGAKRHIRKDYIDLSLLGAEIDPALAALPGKEVNSNASEKQSGVPDDEPGNPKD